MLKIANHPIYRYVLPEGHRFPMVKYELLPKVLIDQKICTPRNFFKPQRVSPALILKVHGENYYNKVVNLSLDKREIRKIGFPLRQELVEGSHYIIGGTIQGANML